MARMAWEDFDDLDDHLIRLDPVMPIPWQPPWQPPAGDPQFQILPVPSPEDRYWGDERLLPVPSPADRYGALPGGEPEIGRPNDGFPFMPTVIDIGIPPLPPGMAPEDIFESGNINPLFHWKNWFLSKHPKVRELPAAEIDVIFDRYMDGIEEGISVEDLSTAVDYVVSLPPEASQPVTAGAGSSGGPFGRGGGAGYRSVPDPLEVASDAVIDQMAYEGPRNTRDQWRATVPVAATRGQASPGLEVVGGHVPKDVRDLLNPSLVSQPAVSAADQAVLDWLATPEAARFLEQKASEEIVLPEDPGQYGTWIGGSPREMYIQDWVDIDGDGIDDRWQEGPGRPDWRETDPAWIESRGSGTPSFDTGDDDGSGGGGGSVGGDGGGGGSIDPGNLYGLTPEQRLGQALAAIQRQAGRLGVNYDTSLADIGKAYSRGTTGLETGYAQRGVHDSGIRTRGLADYGLYAGPSGTQEMDLLSGLWTDMSDLVTQELAGLGAYGADQWAAGLGAADQAVSDVTDDELYRRHTTPLLKEALG